MSHRGGRQTRSARNTPRGGQGSLCNDISARETIVNLSGYVVRVRRDDATGRTHWFTIGLAGTPTHEAGPITAARRTTLRVLAQRQGQHVIDPEHGESMTLGKLLDEHRMVLKPDERFAVGPTTAHGQHPLQVHCIIV